MTAIHGASCIAVNGRAVMIEGPPGSGKSSLALALIDRGAMLIGDDGLNLELRGKRLYASPPPNIAGLLEVRNLGLLNFPAIAGVLVALVVRIDPQAPRYIESASQIEVCGARLPLIGLWPSDHLALKVELALRHHGLDP